MWGYGSWISSARQPKPAASLFATRYPRSRCCAPDSRRVPRRPPDPPHAGREAVARPERWSSEPGTRASREMRSTSARASGTKETRRRCQAETACSPGDGREARSGCGNSAKRSRGKAVSSVHGATRNPSPRDRGRRIPRRIHHRVQMPRPPPPGAMRRPSTGSSRSSPRSTAASRRATTTARSSATSSTTSSAPPMSRGMPRSKRRWTASGDSRTRPRSRVNSPDRRGSRAHPARAHPGYRSVRCTSA